ncbi:MAG: hypothetical protein ACLRTQ_08160 [Candidatus Borkfalkia sp.]
MDKNAEFTILGPLDAVDAQGKAIENSGAFVKFQGDRLHDHQ